MSLETKKCGFSCQDVLEEVSRGGSCLALWRLHNLSLLREWIQSVNYPGPSMSVSASKGDAKHGLWHRVRREHGHWLNKWTQWRWYITSWRVKAVSCINYHSDFSKCLSSEEELLRSTHWFICWAFTPGRSYFNSCSAHVFPALGSEMHLDEVLEICLYPCVL